MIIGMLMKLEKANKRTTPKNLIDYFRKGIEEFQNNGEKNQSRLNGFVKVLDD